MQEGTATKATRREWIGLAVLCLPALLTSLDIGALFLALPHLTTDLGASGTEQLWITDIYGFMIAGFLITMGTLGDRIGRRKLLLIGAAAFGVMSVLAAYSTSAEMLIVTRALLGISGATLMPSIFALLSSMFRDMGQMRTAISIVVSFLMAGAALGPVVGGVLLEHFWWGAAFLLGVPAMIVLLIAGPFILPEYKAPHAGRIDLLSVALSLVAILPIVYGLKELVVNGIDHWVVPMAALVVGVLFLVFFARRQLRLESPLLNLNLFRNRLFSVTVTSLVFISLAMAGTFLLVSQYIQSVLGLTTTETGIWLAPAGLGIAVGTFIAPMLAQKLGMRTAIVGGLVVAAGGFLIITAAAASETVSLIAVGIAVYHFGAGPLVALGTGIVMGAAPPEQAGSAASVSETSNYFGTTMGMALMGMIGAAVYQAGMNDAVPEGVAADLAQSARDTLAGANVVAAQLPPAQAAELLSRATDAFSTGLVIATVMGAVIFAAAALANALAHRPAPGSGAGAVPGQAPAQSGDADLASAGTH